MLKSVSILSSLNNTASLPLRISSVNGGAPSGWSDDVIGPFNSAWFVKQQNNQRDGVKMVHDEMAWQAPFSWGESWISFKFYVMHER